MPDTITCTICGNELRTTLDQYGPPQAPLCLRHWNEYQDGQWSLIEKRTPVTDPVTPIKLRGYMDPMFDGYTYTMKETN